MKKRRISTTHALMLRIWALALGLWLAAMSYITIVVAQDIVAQNQAHLQLYTPHFSSVGDDTATERLDMLDLTTGLDMFAFTDTQLPLVQDPFDGMDSIQRAERGVDEVYDTATVFLDASGQQVLSAGPYLTVTYQDEATWHSGSEDTTGETFIDLAGSGYDYTPWVVHDHFRADLDPFCQGVRYTGYFQEDCFVLLAVHTFRAPERLYDPEDHTYGQLDREGRLEWSERFDHTAGTDRELVRIYAQSARLLPPHSLPVEADGIRYDTLEDLMRHQLQEGEGYDSDSLIDSVMVRIGTYTDTEGRRCRYATAIHTYPLRTAMLRLVLFYLTTSIAVVVIVLLIWWKLHRQIHRPLTQILACAQDGLAPLKESCDPKWKEPQELERLYMDLGQKLRQLEAENDRLTAKLDYAENAEQHRRQLISGITHELKTPLAVIHSYAEGLCQDIDADKREHYTQVIQEEVEQMDSMVLQMLDLSRLEAGKVKLELSSFSLLGLTRSIQEKLDMLLRERSLELHYGPVEDFQIYADEARIAQVVTELITNAIKYAPETTAIQVGIYRHKGTTCFDIENQSPPLPEEDISRLWDSFYRGDATRSEPGTGLGLTIVRTIVDLHGGTCSAYATATGLRIRFTLP